MKSIRILITSLSLLVVGVFISAGAVSAYTTSAGGGTFNYGQRWAVWGQVSQYSNYYHGSRMHRSTAMQNGSYYYSNGNPNTWYGSGIWATVQGPWTWGLNTYNSYYATR